MKKSRAYDPKKIEPKWQKYWLKKLTFKAKDKGNKKMILVEFPYPSGTGLHMGHMRPFIAGDVVSKYYKLLGFDVMYPMGWDAFGLPAENFAIKNKVHPSVSTAKNVANAKKQLLSWGTGFDWSREINTTDPSYYKWTQKIFLEFFKSGLAFESTGLINWCPKDKTGLANEEVIDGKCERCGTVVEKKSLRQWYLKITDYAEKLLEGLKNLPEWPDHVKLQQENWIGRSEGVNFKCKIRDLGIEVKMYNSVPQTYHAETFTVIAPEHPLVPALIKGLPQEKEVLEFVERIKRKKAENKFDIENDLEGIFTGRFVESFADTGRDLPIWIASYVLADYGTGIVNASAHDLRDFAFAKKYSIPLRPVMFPADPIEKEKIKNREYAYVKDPEGTLEEPSMFKGRKWGEARQDIINHIVTSGFGERKVNYKMRDWVFSRQRYWGEPIPLIHCDKCGVVAVPDKDLPVKLPNVKDYEPTGTGESPLAAIDKWVNVKCPKCEEEKKKTKHLIFDFDGVIGDTYASCLKTYVSLGIAPDIEAAKKKVIEFFTRHPENHGRNEDYTPEERQKELVEKWQPFGTEQLKHGIPLFVEFIKEIKKLKNVKVAVVSAGSGVYVIPAMKESGLKTHEVFCAEESFSKHEKIEMICKDWGIDVKESYYFTDAQSDVFELENELDRKKIIGCAWGYLGYDLLKEVLPESQLLKEFKDIHNLFTPGKAKRETNTMPQWAGSSWYWLRYMDTKNKKEFSSMKLQKYWSPVDLYFGGMEHTTLHLLYSRFWNLMLYDRGLVAVKEPYKKRVPHGIILGPDGEKMSKSRGNVVNPDDVVSVYGADTTRLYMMFLGPHGAQVAWNDKGIVGCRRFLERASNMSEFLSKTEPKEVTMSLHKTIKKVTEDLETYSFNTAVSAMMIFVNTVYEAKSVTAKSYGEFVKILAPFAPHLSEEIWAELGNLPAGKAGKRSVYESKWPAYEEGLTVDQNVVMVIQINGKVRSEITLARDLSDEEVKKLVLADPKVASHVAQSEVRKVIVVKNRLVNVVI